MSKKVLYLSNFSKQTTGFARHAKTILTSLYKDGYEMVEVACCIPFSHPALKSVPWKCYGTVPDNPAEFAAIQNNHQLMEAMHFGNMTIDKIIREEKPDCIILVEDIWKIAWAFWKPWFNKIPTLIHTPIDSSPVLPFIKDNKEKLKNIWVKTDFAVKDLEGIGIKAKCVPLLTDQSYFKPLPKPAISEFRKFYGLDDKFVIGFVFRNQLRKLVVSLLRGFKEFKDKYPESKAKLLLHTCFEEENGGGWRIMTAANNIGVDPEDILSTYLCHSCKSVQILPFKGHVLTCGRCQAQALKHPTIEVGVTDEELNVIYNLMDFYCHPATSGGFEGPMAESSLAGIPSATCNYAFGETFCSGHSLPISFTIVDERESGFMKSQPVNGAICDVMEEVYTNREHYREVGLKAREWALEKFDTAKGIQEFKNWIDSSENLFDYNFYDLKDVDYPPNYSLETNVEFVQDLYNGVFGLHLVKDSPDIQKYCEMLKFHSREYVVNEIKNMARQVNQQQKPHIIQDFILKNDKKKLAVVCRGSAIECFNLLGFIKPLQEKYPDYDLYICAQSEHAALFETFEIANFIPYHPQMEDWKALTGFADWSGVFDKAYILPEIQYES